MVLFRIRQERHRVILNVPRFSISLTIKVLSFELLFVDSLSRAPIEFRYDSGNNYLQRTS